MEIMQDVRLEILISCAVICPKGALVIIIFTLFQISPLLPLLQKDYREQ